MTISRQDFSEFNVHNSANLTFCQKEMKAILSFCEHTGQPVELCFEKAGKPMLLMLHYFNVIEADFVLATLMDQSEYSDASSQESTNESSNRLIPFVCFSF